MANGEEIDEQRSSEGAWKNLASEHMIACRMEADWEDWETLMTTFRRTCVIEKRSLNGVN